MAFRKVNFYDRPRQVDKRNRLAMSGLRRRGGALTIQTKQTQPVLHVSMPKVARDPGGCAMLQPKMPDICPVIAQAEATASARSLPAAWRAAAFSIGAVVLVVALSNGWSMLAKLGRGPHLEISAVR